jgi:hypothetical protein
MATNDKVTAGAKVPSNQTQVIERIVVPSPPVNVQVNVPDKKSSLLDAAVYAPAMPGILVALFGLWAAHALAQRRDRKKSISDLCEALKKMVGVASSSAIDAWLEPVAADRVSGVASTKRLLQSAGITATTIKRRTDARRSWGIANKVSIRPFSVLERRSIDLISHVARLRQIAMQDPFEDPSRGADSSKVNSINAAASSLISSADRALFDYQG